MSPAAAAASAARGASELRALPAPAKLNLFLHVTGRRADGYHELETVFELVDLSDRIDLLRLEAPVIELATPQPGIAPEDDLCVRAARLLARHCGCRLGVRIALEKRIPLGGGLGGGSSDAATVLIGLNRLWGTRLARAQLQALAARLGADVPVFVFGRTAYATGVGERLRALPLPPRRYLVLAPQVAVSTAEIFAAPELTRNSKALKISGLSRGLQVFRGRNDLQSVVVGRHREVALALEALRRAARASSIDPALARMSGSGACVFLPVDRGVVVGSLVDRVHREFGEHGFEGRILVVDSIPEHPLRDWCDD